MHSLELLFSLHARHHSLHGWQSLHACNCAESMVAAWLLIIACSFVHCMRASLMFFRTTSSTACCSAVLVEDVLTAMWERHCSLHICLDMGWCDT